MVPQQLKRNQDTMGKCMYWTGVAAILLLKVVQGMRNQSCRINKATLEYIVS